MNKIEDFGQKIGGARKDTWSSRGLLLEDTIDMNEMEKLQYVTKENIWPLPDAKKQVHEGMDNYVAFFIRKMRRIANTKPMARHNTDTDIVIKDYINAMVSFRKRVEQIKTVNDMADFFTECKAKSETGAYWNITEWKAAVDGWKIQEFYINLRYYKRKCESTNFPYGKKSVSKKEILYTASA